MLEIWEKISCIINTTIFDELLGILSTFISICISFVVFFSPKIKISKKILRGVNFSNFKEYGEVAWKFKIVNKSMLVSFFEFDIKLTGIKYKIIEDGSVIEHRENIKICAGIRELARYEPRFITFLKRKNDSSYTVSYVYRPLTYVNLEEAFLKYDKIELSVKYVDSLIGRIHHTKKYSENTIIQGDFSNDGRLNCVLPNTISSYAWKNHLEKRDKSGNLK